SDGGFRCRVREDQRERGLRDFGSVGDATAILLGCVSGKGERAAPARELYRSQLWRGRRGYAEASGRPWLILSALHGLVMPDDVLAPYDLALADLSAVERRLWGDRVVSAMAKRFPVLAGAVFEIHAGKL